LKSVWLFAQNASWFKLASKSYRFDPQTLIARLIKLKMQRLRLLNAPFQQMRVGFLAVAILSGLGWGDS
jgi:hypothetical protein